MTLSPGLKLNIHVAYQNPFRSHPRNHALLRKMPGTLMKGGMMGYRCLMAVALGIILTGCSSPPIQKPTKEQNPHVTPEGIRITPDVAYGHKFGMALTFDMYQPKKQNGAGVLLINSGGYRSNFANFYKEIPEGLCLVTKEDLEQMTPNLRGNNIEPLLAKGITVFVVRHGSRPKFGMSEIVADLRRAVRFVRFHADEYGVDKERIGIWGGSTGGHLSLLLGLTAEIGISEATEEFEKGSGRIAAVVAYFPITDLKRHAEYKISTGKPYPEDHPVKHLTAEQFKEFSPLYFASSDDPPTLIVHGDQDTAVPIIEGESMHQVLLKAGVQSKFITIPGAGHGFFDKDADQALAETVNWFENYLITK
jgi:dienelactone hydrolase